MSNNTVKSERRAFDSFVTEFDTILPELDDEQKSYLYVKLLSRMNWTLLREALSCTLKAATAAQPFLD